MAQVLVLTNDDGYDAPGIAALDRAVTELQLGSVRWVAPAEEQSGCGHQINYHRLLVVEERDRGFSVASTPADCVRLAVSELAPEVSLVLSGINAGGNLGADVYNSGTVAAAREATLHGQRAIALSHWIRRPLEINWDWAARQAMRVLPLLLDRPWEPDSFWNVNFPHLDPDAPDPEIVFCELSRDPVPPIYRRTEEGYQYNGIYGGRPYKPGTDVAICFGGAIAVTQLRI